MWDENEVLLDDYVEDYSSAEVTNVRRTLDWVEKGATVKFVSVNSATGRLSVSLRVKGGE